MHICPYTRVFVAMKEYKKYALVLFVSASMLAAGSATAQPKFVEISGKQQRILDRGKGAPTVIFVAGLGSDMRSFSKIQFEISKLTRTISYDRAGIGKSEPIEGARSIDSMVEELNLILSKEYIMPPYLLVGHSFGGYILRLFADYYPEQVCGLIFIDPASEKLTEARRAIRSQEERERFDSLLSSVDYSKLPTGFRQEMSIANSTAKELIKNVLVPKNMPVTLLTSIRFSPQERDGGETQADIQVWVDLHKAMIANAPQVRHLLTDKSGHHIHKDEPELVISEIKRMIFLLKHEGGK